MAEPEITYGDSEFSISGNEKIDYKLILFKQVDYIRFLRTQDMGEFTLLDFDVIPKDEMFLLWFSRSSTYQNSVKSLQSLLKTHYDTKYLDKIKEIIEDYDLKLKTELDKIKAPYKKVRTLYERQRIELHKKLLNARRLYSLKEIPLKYDEIFEECLILMQRAKFISGDEFITEISRP